MLRRPHILGGVTLAAAVIVTVALGPAMPWTERASADRVLQRALAVPPTVVPTTTVPATVPEATTTVPVSTTTAPPTTLAAPAPRFTLEPYRGLGAWLDVYDWSSAIAPGGALEPDAIDALAAEGVQTLFIQASKWDAPEDVLEPGRLMEFINRAHQHGMSVVGWYLPTLEDPARDIQRLLAIAALPIEGLAVDIESRKVADVPERNRRLVEMSSALRAALPGEVLGAIPLEPVLLEEVNPYYWPWFPWAEISPSYDVWLPMSYWTNRLDSSPWSDAYFYTSTNIDRVRAEIGRPDAPVHALGGIGDRTSAEDMQGFRAAASDRFVIGASIYDFRTTAGDIWPELVPFRDLRPPR